MYILLKYIEQITSLGDSTANMSDRLHCSIFLLFPFTIYDPAICHRLLATALLFLYVFLLVPVCHCDKIQMLQGGQFSKC